MGAQQVRIGIRGRISDATATALGGRLEEVDDGFELVVPHIDHAQVTGLLVHLGDLHIPFHHVAVSSTTDPAPADPASTGPAPTDPPDVDTTGAST